MPRWAVGLRKMLLTGQLMMFCLMKRENLKACLMREDSVGYELLPANADLTGAEVTLLEVADPETSLKEALAPIRADYSYVIIDCPPSLNMLTVNALVAADAVVIPTQCEYYALEGLSGLLETISKIQRVLNPKLKIEGLLRTMFDSRNNLANEVSQQLLDYFGDKEDYQTIIPRNVRLAQGAPSHGLPVITYDKSSAGALAYLSLAGEFLRKEGLSDL